VLVRRERPAVAAAILALLPAAGSAQLCHAAPEPDGLSPGVELSLSGEAASYRNSRWHGHWWGGAVEAAWATRWFQVSARMPWYDLDRNRLVFRGPGDLTLGTRVPLWRTAGGGLALGAELSASLPTGDEALELGMGHAMIMPGVFGVLDRGDFAASALVGWGRALGSASGHVHGAAVPKPLVGPMNMEELEVSLAGTWRFLPAFSVRASVAGAEPVGRAGLRRAAAGAGIWWAAAGFSVGLEGQLPLAGDPYRARGIATVGYRLSTGSSPSP
jgi:hypothetical protein